MNNKKHVKDFIEHYLENKDSCDQNRGFTQTTPINGLIEPLLADSFKLIPEKYWYGVTDGPKGPYGLLKVSVFGVPPKEMASLYFYWANERLQIVPETALIADLMQPIASIEVVSIDLTNMTIKDFAEFIITRIVATTLEGK